MTKPLQWFRFYAEVVNDPKVQRLPGDMFKAWVNLMCLACSNGGAVPKDDIAFALRITPKTADGIVAYLVERNLLDDLGGVVTPHNWNERQFHSDDSKERVKRYRERQRNARRNVTSTVTVTAQEQSRADTESEQNVGGGVAAALTDEIAKELGFPDPKDWPAAFMGAQTEVQSWLNHGWKPEIILTTVKQAVRSGAGDGPIESVRFFKTRIARAHAAAARPLPVVTVLPAQEITTHARSERPDHIGEGIDRLRARLRSADDAAGDQGSRPDEDRGVVEILPPRKAK